MTRIARSAEPERRLALLKAAFREVAEKGFSDVTLDDIARRASVSKGVTLYYFDSKDELFRELFGWLIDSIHARMREAVAAESDPVAEGPGARGADFPVALQEPGFLSRVRGFLADWPRGARPFREVNERFYAGCREIDGGIVEEGMRRGVFVVRDPKEGGSTMRAIFDGLMIQWLSEKDPEATFAAYRERCERELLSLPARSAAHRKGKTDDRERSALPADLRERGLRAPRRTRRGLLRRLRPGTVALPPRFPARGRVERRFDARPEPTER